MKGGTKGSARPAVAPVERSHELDTPRDSAPPPAGTEHIQYPLIVIILFSICRALWRIMPNAKSDLTVAFKFRFKSFHLLHVAKIPSIVSYKKDEKSQLI